MQILAPGELTGDLLGLVIIAADPDNFRAEERGSRASLASCADLSKGEWTVRDLTTSSLGQWEPSFDLSLWRRDHLLHVFVQRAEQLDAEGVGALPPQMVYVAEVQP